MTYVKVGAVSDSVFLSTTLLHLIGAADALGPTALLLVATSEGLNQHMNRAYELMVIVDGDVEDPAAQSWVKAVSDGITQPEVPPWQA